VVLMVLVVLVVPVTKIQSSLTVVDSEASYF
jgi:hypothetical protein